VRFYILYLCNFFRYNICRGNLKEIKHRTRDLYELMMSNFINITPKWEHMTRCFIESFNYYPLLYMPYKMIVVFAMDTLNISMPHLYASMSYTEWIAYKISRWAYREKLPNSDFHLTRALSERNRQLNSTAQIFVHSRTEQETLLLLDTVVIINRLKDIIVSLESDNNYKDKKIQTYYKKLSC
jgi:hypothetical protein